jgi:hypothetical protein
MPKNGYTQWVEHRSTSDGAYYLDRYQQIPPTPDLRPSSQWHLNAVFRGMIEYFERMWYRVCILSCRSHARCSLCFISRFLLKPKPSLANLKVELPRRY